MAFAQLENWTVAGVVDGVDLRTENAESIAITGLAPHQATRLLRSLAGLEAAEAGEISIDGAVLTGLAGDRSEIALVPAEPALSPHLSVLENIALPLRAAGAAEDEIRERTDDLAKLLRLRRIAAPRLAELCAADRLRVALGRALARRPQVLVLDDPLAGLRDNDRFELRLLLRRIQRELALVVLFASASSAEAMAIADRILHIAGGRVQQCDTPLHVYSNPASRSAARALGTPEINLLAAHYDGYLLRIGDQLLEAPGLIRTAASFGDVELGIRPESFDVAGSPRDSVVAILDPSSNQFLGSHSLVHGSVASRPVTVFVAGHPVEVPRRAYASLPSLLCFCPRSGDRLR